MTGQGGLRDLVTAWREQAVGEPDAGYATALGNCADELQAGLDKWAADLIRNVTADLERSSDEGPAFTAEESEAAGQRLWHRVTDSAACTACGHLGNEHGARACMARGCACTRVRRADR